MDEILRRQFLIAAGVLLTTPICRAQQPAKVFRIGALSLGSPSTAPRIATAFRQALGELGYVEGQNLIIERRYAEGNADRLPGFAAELVRNKVDAIVVSSGVEARIAKEATSTIPIVSVTTTDPVASGYAASFSRPAGNFTGTATNPVELVSKRVELLKETIPKAKRVAVFHPARIGVKGSFKSMLAETQRAASTLNLETLVLEVETREQIERAFETAGKWHADAVLLTENPQLFFSRALLAELSVKHRLPMMCPERNYAEAGGLMSYGVDYEALFRRAAVYVAKILKGAKPGDLPIEMPTKFELAVNMKTAKALGITIPQSVLLRADRVIE